MMMGTTDCWRKTFSLWGQGVFIKSALWLRECEDHFSCWGTGNTCSIIRYSKSVCILKVLYITVIMHWRMPLAQLLTFARHRSREQDKGSTGDSACMRSLEESLFTKRKQSFHRKSSAEDPWTFIFLFLVLNQFPSPHPDSGSRDH